MKTVRVLVEQRVTRTTEEGTLETTILSSGSEVELEDAQAAALIDQRQAEAVKPKAKPPAAKK